MTGGSFFHKNCLKIWFCEENNWFSTLECQLNFCFCWSQSISNFKLWLLETQVAGIGIVPALKGGKNRDTTLVVILVCILVATVVFACWLGGRLPAGLSNSIVSWCEIHPGTEQDWIFPPWKIHYLPNLPSNSHTF